MPSARWRAAARRLPTAGPQRGDVRHLEKKYAHLGVSEVRLRLVEEETTPG
jgi:hypothetical protein